MFCRTLDTSISLPSQQHITHFTMLLCILSTRGAQHTVEITEIFLSLRFYVKSKLTILEYQNLPFSYIERLWNLKLMIFCTFWRLNVTKFTKFRGPKIAKTEVLGLIDYLESISRKIWVTENCENSTLCHNIMDVKPILNF